jgi:hypothetical protein
LLFLKQMSANRKLSDGSIGFILSLCLVFGGAIGGWIVVSEVSNVPVFAQTLNPEEVATAVYQKFPDLPLENQYIDRESQEIAEQNTLVSRLVRYHQYIKSRPTKYRIDWQLTFADYFGINETILENRYPGSSTLTVNPVEIDRQVIKNLTQQQRSNLIDILVEIYGGKVTNN